MAGSFEELFGSDPVDDPSGEAGWLQVVRVKGGNWRRYVSLSDQLLTAWQHWWRSRSVICVGAGCPACGKVVRRCLCYLGVKADRETKPSVRQVLELPSGAGVVLTRHVEGVFGSADSLSGARFSCRREHGDVRGLVQVEGCPEPSRVEVGVGVSRWDVLRSLCKLWRVPVLEEQSDVEAWRQKVLSLYTSEEFYR